MGLPLSYFNLFWAIQNRERPGATRARRVLKPYTLFAFVLYDLRDDFQLHGKLTTDWSHLDTFTGQHLLFFAPVDPPQVMTRGSSAPTAAPDLLRPRRGQAVLDRLAGARGYLPLASRDPSHTTAALRQLLGVSPGMSSCLAITSSLRNRDLWLLATDAKLVAPQLERLGLIANQLQRDPANRDILSDLIARIASDHQLVAERITLSNTLAALLTDVCAVTATHSNVNDSLTTRRAWDHLRLVASTMRDAPSRADDADANIRSCLRIGALFGSVGGYAEPPTTFGLGHDRDQVIFASARTQQLLVMADNCMALLQDGAIDPAAEPDYRVAVALWSQALEQEMAELLGHEVREGLGVDLPDYHWRYQPRLTRAFIKIPNVGRRSEIVLFNRARPQSCNPDRKLWMPPAMGPLRLGWEHWRKERGIPASEQLSRCLLACTNLRNRACHPSEPISRVDAQEAKQQFRAAIESIRSLGIRDWSITRA